MKRKKKTTIEVVAKDVVSRETPGIGAKNGPVRVVTATEREANAVTASLKEAYHQFSTAWFEMGRRVKEALDRQVPAALGMNAHEWMLSVFGETASVAKIHRSLRIARALEKLPEEKVKLLTEGKAYSLTQLPESMRTSEEWIEKAVTETNDEFKKSVQSALEAKGFPPEERLVTITVRVAESIAVQWDEAEKKVADLLNLDIELKPGQRAVVFEAIASMINNTDSLELTVEMIGDDGKPPEASKV